jgi:DNA-directed RNA polymerase specialized sigma24 family protein
VSDKSWSPPPGPFPPTRLSVLHRIRSDDHAERQQAFDTLAAAYWKPVYKYLRLRWRATAEDAEDTTQAFLAAAFEKQFFDRFDPAQARFRTFLRVCLDRFVQNQLKAAGRQKRGSGQRVLSLDFEDAEGEVRRHEPSAPADVDELFRREVMRALFTRAVADVRDDYQRRGREAQFRLFERYDLEAEEGLSYATLAAETGLPVTQITNHLAAVRRAFRAAALAHLRALTTSDEEYRAEARDLFGADLP